MAHETFLTLLKDPAHWEFEIFLILIFDVILGILIWPRISKFLLHHKSDDERIEELEKKVNEFINK
jgi:hypothetical protein